MATLEYELPKHEIGTKFTYQPGSHKQKYEATIIGYLVMHTTDTVYTNVTYRISYDYIGQELKISVPRSTVDRALLAEA